jgi:hypothetical protein
MNKLDKSYKEIIENMMSIAGYDVTYEDLLKEEDGWWSRYTMTLEQRDKWVEDSINFLRKNMRWPKYRAKNQMVWVELMWGLRILDTDLSNADTN